jgi:hypothetical protein
VNKSLVSSALKSGLIVGVLDITAACVNAYLQKGITPGGVLRYVASGFFGKEAFEGGAGMAAMGLLFHFTIAISWTALFFVLYEKVKILQLNKIYVGLGYGIVVWLGMNFVVLPLSNVSQLVYRLVPTVIMIGIHMFVIGLSISLLANNYFERKSQIA